MAKWIAVDRVRARLQHVVVCRNGTRWPKEKIARNRRAHAGSFAIVYQSQLAGVILSFSGVAFV